MSVIGLGVDLADTARIRALLEKSGERFKARVFTTGECAYCDSCADPTLHYTARFAAKEAAAKALGTGFAEGVSWQDIEVVREPSGAPRVVLHGGAAVKAGELGVKKILLSLTHTDSAAAAAVVMVG